ncbi:MAG TPA: class I SAM-dependent methyltransferase [Terriglobales bacterium]|nr:class I SAM-dependent methyltransferase [Terriglobales bacterium]
MSAFLTLPPNFSALADLAWERARALPGFIGERELRALLMLAAAAPAAGSPPGAPAKRSADLEPRGPRVGVSMPPRAVAAGRLTSGTRAVGAPGPAPTIVEIGSFKGKSTVGLATLAQALGLGPVVSIDPHDSPSVTDPGVASYHAFMANLAGAGLREMVEVHRACSRDVAPSWRRPIRLLWIDGDHTYAGAREDFELFSPFLADGALVALHDSLHFFEGPIRVMVDHILASDRFGPAGFLHTIAWAQFRPQDGARWRAPRRRLARRAARLLPLVAPPRQNRGLNRLRYKLALAQVPHAVPAPEAWLAQANA